MADIELLAEEFEGHRPHLRAVAYRMLGSPHEAEDAVQEAWLRLGRADAAAVENLGGWLTTVVARVCLDVLRSRGSRREEPYGLAAPDPPASVDDGSHPEREALLADSVGLALLVVLDTLTPVERLAFVLHDMFDIPFEEIAPVIDRSPAAARQAASRARRRVRGSAVPQTRANEDLVKAFLAASREGDFAALVAMLAPDAVLRSDRAAIEVGAPPEARGAEAVAGTFAGRARAARLAFVNGVAAAAWAPGGTPRVLFAFSVAAGRIVEIEIIAGAGRIRRLAPALA